MHLIIKDLVSMKFNTVMLNYLYPQSLQRVLTKLEQSISIDSFYRVLNFTCTWDVIVSVVKVGSISKNLYIERIDSTRLHGITPVTLTSLETVTLSVGGALHNFQVVPNNFPM